MADYASAAGFVQFDPREREANGQKVIDYTIKSLGADGTLIRITVWPELQGVEIEKGDFLAADGKFSVNPYTDNDTGVSRQSLQISATALAVTKAVPKADREVVNTGSAQNKAKKLF